MPVARGVEPKKFPEAKHGDGELRYVEGVPVLTVRGKPAEIGEQFGVLAIKNAPDLTGLHERFLKDAGFENQYALLGALSGKLKPNFPPDILTELEHAATASNRKLAMLVFADTVADLSSGLGCSTVVVSQERSKSGKPLFGRNFDWLPVQGIAEHTLVVVYKGEGKHAFAAITVSPISGVISGMNDAGLSVTMNEISIKQSKDKAPFNWNGTPLMILFRQVLEKCTTVAESEKFVRAASRTTTVCMTICDKEGGAVFEITPKNVVVRNSEHGVCCCTNHFRCEMLCTDEKCDRYEKLAPLVSEHSAKLDVAGVFKELDKVHQGKFTLQSMVFEPAERVLNLAYGPGPSTKLHPKRLDLGKLFDQK
ncbi:MAG TPA: C45 family peptidase [Gemmata sp.]|nr:C45 family peptidase [Gemmata sp.]